MAEKPINVFIKVQIRRSERTVQVIQALRTAAETWGAFSEDIVNVQVQQTKLESRNEIVTKNGASHLVAREPRGTRDLMKELGRVQALNQYVVESATDD